MLLQRGSTMRVFRPFPNVLAFYDGRIEGVRAWSEEPNWLDDGAFSLGACSYAIVDGTEALVYDTHISVEHAAVIRRTLEDCGVRSIRVVLSHWHADHVAGNSAFRDCEIIANSLTAKILAERRAELESGNPPILPLVLPTCTFDQTLRLQVGTVPVELRQVDIHSQDGTLLVMPAAKLLLAGDALEDPITFVAEPDRLERHLLDLDGMRAWDIDRILPNHGSAATIEAGGYDKTLIDATKRYVEKLLRASDEPALAEQDLRTFVAEDLRAGTIGYFAAYDAVHRRNVERVRGRAQPGHPPA